MRKLAPLAMALLLALAVHAQTTPRITLHLENVDISVVLKHIANKMHWKLTLDPAVKGLVTVHWDDMPAGEALRELLSVHGYDGKIANNTLIVFPAATAETRSRKQAPAPRPHPASVRGRDYDHFNTEAYDRIDEIGFREVGKHPLSTFSIDVDTASYSNVRRFLNDGQLPPPDAVRIEEMINYFTYEYPDPKPGQPFSITTEVARCPWNQESTLLRIGLKSPGIREGQMPPRNLTFLIDVSGSMQTANKLPLVRSSLKTLVQYLNEKDTVSVVVYAGSSGLVLPPTRGDQKQTILDAISRLEAGGSTNGGAGIELAYATARKNFDPKGVNRVILCTDGDFNVGVTDQGQLTRLIEKERESGVFLSVLGYGMGNIQDSTLEKLADRGNGQYAYIDSLDEARKVLVSESGSSLVTVAKDVKLQVEFNPTLVGSYRLVGYENRMLRDEDFQDDKKDAGEMGAGHSVTALYELRPPTRSTSGLRYQNERQSKNNTRELAFVKARYKEPQGTKSVELDLAVPKPEQLSDGSRDMRFASAVAVFGMLLRNSEFRGTATYALIPALMKTDRPYDPGGYRAEFGRLVQAAEGLAMVKR